VSTGFLFRPVEKSDSHNIHALLVSAGLMSKDSMKAWEDYSNWAFWQNPYRGSLPAGWVAEDEEGLLAYKGATIVPYRTSRFSGLGASVGNLSVRKGANPAFAAMFTRKHLRNGGVDVQFGAHFNDLSGKIWLPMVTAIGELSDVTYSKILSRHAVWKKRLLQRGLPGRFLVSAGGARLLGWMHSMADPTKFPEPGEDVPLRSRRIDRFSEIDEQTINQLCREAEAGLDFTLERSQQYLAWRYEAHPRANDYSRIVLSDDKDVIRGLGVLEMKNDTALVYECIVNPDDRQAQIGLIRTLAEFALAEGKTEMVSKAVTRPVSSTLESMNFQPTRKPYDQYLLWEKNGDKPAIRGETLVTYDEFRFS
jgi:hypothetical protein